MAFLDSRRQEATGSPDYICLQYIELTLLDLQYLSRMLHVVQNQLRVYIFLSRSVVMRQVH